MTADAIHTFSNENRLLSRKIVQILNLFILPDGASLGSAIAVARCGVTSTPSTSDWWKSSGAVDAVPRSTEHTR